MTSKTGEIAMARVDGDDGDDGSRRLHLVRSEPPVDHRIRGRVENFAVSTVLQLLDMERCVASLHVTAGGREGRLDVGPGRLLTAATDRGQTGLEAAAEMLGWARPQVEWHELSGDHPGDPELDLPLSHLLLDLARERDETNRSTPPTGQTPRDVDTPRALPSRPAEPLDRESVLSAERTEALAGAMASIMSLGGAVGACLVDTATGQMIVSQGDRRCHLELTATTGGQVMAARRQAFQALELDEAVEDVVVTLGEHLHLARPLAGCPDLLFYLVLRKDHADLNAARHRLDGAEARLHQP